MDRIVLDSSVVNKLFLDEPDRVQALEVIHKISEDEVEAIAPSLIAYEVVNVLNKVAISRKEKNKILSLLYSLFDTNILLVEPSLKHLAKAMDITNSGHQKSGYPSLYDSIYHAIAIVDNCLFITADKKHYSKTKQLGHITLLKDF